MLRNGTPFLIAAIMSAFAFHPALAASSEIQMLPPLDFSGNVCAGTNGGVLYWDGATSIKCIPNMVGNSSGWVSIGTSSPLYPLTIQGSAPSTLAGFTDGVYGTLFVDTKNPGNTNIPSSGGIDLFGDASFFSFTVQNIGEMMRITNTGRVGIGTTQPGAVLDIYGADTGLNTTWGQMLFRAQDGMARPAVAIYGDIDGTPLADETLGALAVRNVTGTGRSITTSGSIYVGGTNGAPTDPGGWGDYWDGTSIMTIGRVGVGTTSPGAMLDVYYPDSGQGQPEQGATIFRAMDGQYRSVVTMQGGVDGTPIPTVAALNVGGNGALPFSISANGAINGQSYYIGGNCWVGACTSDIRVKDHIRPFKPGLDALLAINPIYYRLTGQGGTIKSDHDLLGVAAQDVEKGAPELVVLAKVKLNPGDKEETEIKKVDYTGLPYIVINAVKELYAKWSDDHGTLAALKADNDNLRVLVNAQGKEIEELKTQLKTAH